jgi:MFS family permease
MLIALVPAYLVSGGDNAYTNIKTALSLNDAQFAICVGSVFTLTNGCVQLLFGQLADTVNCRRWILLICSVLFCLAVYSMSYVQGFWGFFLARFFFSAFMASNVPISVSLLCDYTVPWERGVAQSMYAMGVYLGVGFSSLSVLLDQKYG